MAAPAIIAAGIMAGGGILQSILGSRSASRAAREQRRAVDRSIASQERLFGETRAELSPYLQAGQQSLSELSRRTLGGEFNRPFTAEMMASDPGFQFRMQQANLALERSSAARGRLLSGGTIRSTAELNQALASQEFGAAYERHRQGGLDEFNRLSSISNIGLSAAGSLAGARQNFGQSLSELYTGRGNVGAAQAAGQGEALQGGLNTVLGAVTDPAFLGSVFSQGPSVAPQSAQVQTGGYPMQRSSNPLDWDV